MNDTEIRERVRKVVGEASYPPGLPSRVQAQLQAPRRETTHPRAIGLIAAILAIAVVAALFAPRLLTQRTSLPRPQPAASPASQSSTIPAQDLAVAHLAAVSSLVVPLHLDAQSGSQRIELFAAYADQARTALFFRMTPDAGFPVASIDDAYGLVNASSSGSRGVPGDYVFTLNAGPRPGIDGIAHLKVSIIGVQPIGPGPSIQGHWTFAPDVHVQASQPIGSYPLRFALGSWKVSLEVIELTPSVVHVQALIDGATVGDVQQKFMTLLDSSGQEVPQIAGGASVTVPKGQLSSTTYKSTRVNDQWERPAAGKYKLRVEGNNASHVVDLEILALGAVTGKGGSSGGGLLPTDFPAAPESLTLQGALATTITEGRPSMCGAGSGPDGIMLFAFATYFQANGNWYWLL
jgi:hypothetical protein